MSKSNQILDAFLKVKGRLSRFLIGMVPPKEVEDIVQEAYVRVCQIEHKKSIRDPEAFIFRTVKNLALDYLKRSESRLTSGVDNIDEIVTQEIDSTYDQVASDEQFAIFCAAVRQLPKQSQRAFILKKVYGHSLREIMVEMDLSQPTVETHIVNATKKCVEYMRNRNVSFSNEDSSLVVKSKQGAEN